MVALIFGFLPEFVAVELQLLLLKRFTELQTPGPISNTPDTHSATPAKNPLPNQVETGADSKTISWQLDDTEISGDTEMIQQDVPLAAGTKKYTVTARLASWYALTV